jgi:hypothetical protein
LKVGANKKRDVRKVKMTFNKGNRKKAVLVILGAPEVIPSLHIHTNKRRRRGPSVIERAQVELCLGATAVRTLKQGFWREKERKRKRAGEIERFTTI